MKSTEEMTDDRVPPTLRSRSHAVAATGVLCLLAFCGSRIMVGPSRDAGSWDVTAAVDGWADESSCIDCHDQPSEFAQTGHAKTLRPVSHPDSVKLLTHLAALDAAQAEGTKIVHDQNDLYAVNESDGLQRQLKLDWCFGSGTHACTWVSAIPDSHGNTDVLEFRWTWFASIGDFGITPGQPETRGNSPVSALGLLFDGPKARRCFSCHATVVPVSDGRIEQAHIHPGVTCQRCHGPRAKHVQTEGDYHPQGWGSVGRMEAVRRCAVCHRLSEEHEPEEIVPGNASIVRFQPVGLLQSACFMKSEMRCTTCHDPHRPMDQQDSLRIQQCIQCHDSKIDGHTTCGAGETDNCLGCHMPKVKMNFPVEFTDHWIRVPSEQTRHEP